MTTQPQRLAGVKDSPTRETSAPVRTEDSKSHYDYEESHPAFGVAIVARRQGSRRVLFQSDLRHRDTVTLTINRAVRARSTHSDWVFPREELIEIEMSQAQWGALVSSVGVGSGVPVTIRRTENVVLVDALTFQPRTATTTKEASESVGKLLESAKKSLDALTEAIESKKGIREIRERLNDHQNVLRNAESNSAFAVRSVTEAAESAVNQARADIESHILRLAQSGIKYSGSVPELTSETTDLGELES